MLEDHLPASVYENHGQRVVEGQRLMQTASDMFLGWTGREDEKDEKERYYWRQLKDMKGSANIETQDPLDMRDYAAICGWTLARAHARSGDPVAIAAYLGSSDAFDRAVTTFAERYADQNERDYAAFTNAIKSGRLEAAESF